ncbi:MAG: hypothetical protein QXG86_02755, partial [Candidatus Woesearchaeota archaeon]
LKMKINISININKEHFYFLVVLVCVLFVLGVSAYNSGSQPAVFGHSDEEIENLPASKINEGAFNGTIMSLFIFPGNLKISNTLNISGGIIFEKKAIINASNNLTVDTPNLIITRNLTLGGISRDHWTYVIKNGTVFFPAYGTNEFTIDLGQGFREKPLIKVYFNFTPAVSPYEGFAEAGYSVSALYLDSITKNSFKIKRGTYWRNYTITVYWIAIGEPP